MPAERNPNVPTKKKKTSSAPKKKVASKAAKPAKKKASAKKTVAKKKAPAKAKATPTKKSSVKKKPSVKKKATAKKKTASKKSSAKKAPGKKKSTAKKASKKTSTASKKAPPKKIPLPQGRKPASRQHPNDFYDEEPVKPKVKPMGKRDLKKFKNLLLELRDRLQGDIRFLTTDNLHRAGRETGADLSGAAQHSADHGTDNFDREFALSLASAEEDVMYEVDEALMRISEGTYGICEHTGVRIEPARLEVIPYTRYSVQAQAKMEQARAGYRPFGQSFKKW